MIHETHYEQQTFEQEYFEEEHYESSTAEEYYREENELLEQDQQDFRCTYEHRWYDSSYYEDSRFL